MKVPAELDDEVVNARAKVRFGFPLWVRPLLFANVVAITIGRRVWISPAVDERELAALIRHELAHVRQFAKHGFVRFLWRYLKEYVQLRRSGLSSSKAYAAISFEREALAAEKGEHV